MQENGEFFAIFSLEDARVASYSLEVRGKNICQTTGKSKTDGGKTRNTLIRFKCHYSTKEGIRIVCLLCVYCPFIVRLLCVYCASIVRE